MRFPLLPTCLLALAAAVCPGLRAAEPALTRLVPADAALVVELRDLPAFRLAFPETAAGRAWADPEIARFFAPLLRHPGLAEFVAKVKAETGHTPAELLAFATGDVLLTVPVASLQLQGEARRVDALLALEVGDNESKIAELLAVQRKQDSATGTATTEDYNGVTLHLVTPAPDAAVSVNPAEPAKPFVWALHQGRWFIASERALVTATLDALAAGGHSQPLAASADYQQVLERAGGRADLLAFFNWKAVYPAVLAAVEASRDPKQPANPLGIEPVALLSALGLDAIESVSFSTGTINDVSRVDAAWTFSEARGVLNLLAWRDGPVARPDWVPAAWFNVSSQNFSLPAAYEELERLLDRISPMLAGLAQGQVKTYERQLRIDLKRDLLGNLGESFIGGYALPPEANADTPPPHDQLDQFVGVSLADAASFERAIETIKAKYLPPGDASPLRKRDYLGRVLHTFAPPAGGRGGTYAIADGWLLLGVGSPGTVESVLQLMNTPNSDAAFWQRKDVRDAMESVPAGAFSVQHTELAPLMASVVASLVQAQEAQEEDNRFVDPSAKPTREQLARYFKHTVSHGTRTSTGYFFHSEGPAR